MRFALLAVLPYLLSPSTALSAAAPSFFLTTDEIEASRGSPTLTRAASSIADWSGGNEVADLVNGREVMLSLLQDCRRASVGDYIFMTAFSVDGSVMLDPEATDPSSTALSEVLLGAVKRGVNVRLLVNENVYLHSAHAFCKPLNDAAEGTVCAPETRHHSMGGSLHAKSWSFVYSGDEVVSYLGSMDIMGDRWDTDAHDESPARQSQPSDLNHFHGWHGDMFRMRGQAAHDVAQHFMMQWNDPAPLAAPLNFFYKLEPFEAELPPLPEGGVGGLAVQLLRSLSCQGGADGLYSSFAPRGEYSFFKGFEKMVKSAKEYIYIEDQFIFFEEAMQLVADALPNVEAVILVTDNATAMSATVAGVDVTVASDMRFYHQRKSMDLLFEDPEQGKKVRVFQLAREGYPVGDMAESWLYTHAKNYFVDDISMIVGSHGIERTGFTNDIELSAAIADPEGGHVGALRRRLWAEFLMMGEGDDLLGDWRDGLAEMERQADSGVEGRVRRYYPEEGRDGVLNNAVYEVYEPDGRCE
ncbi:hypothetical protein TeGR_g7661 [Tetraparma gracilis]|uniref:Phospholipase D n=1 Tax=Tetraparma gracilis TaxID=2962635 RepID=A0ABQ6MP50_9STRA|nr:hypothetical protein TeGR_g7661 [Tetraparma gracilis]